MEKNAAKEQDVRALLKLMLLTLMVMLLLSLFMTGCSYDCEKIQVTYYDHSQIDLTEVRQSVDVMEPREIQEAGGLYHKDGFVYINERGKGIHVIDNSNPGSPAFVAFLSIPGNYGMAARQNFLYADSYIDMLVFDISNPATIALTGREENAFEHVAANDVYYDTYNKSLFQTTTRVETTTECDFDGDYEIVNCCGGMQDDVVMLEAKGGGSNTGDAGSMARFVVDNDVLYTVDLYALNVFDVSNAATPVRQRKVEIGWGIETIFPYNNHLFIGSQNGMYIFNNEVPAEPTMVSVYQHMTACDPVVVKGNYAYVTLRDGQECFTYSNQLDVVDITDYSNPQLARTYQMLNPHGLGIDQQCLFICEGDYGLKSFDIDPVDPTLITQKSFNRSVHAFDVITLPNTLMMVGNDGFYQYQTNCGSDLQYLSKIAF